jgi:hypothetical protein
MKYCSECDGYGWVNDYLGGCGDPECCGGPFEVKCCSCNNTWQPGDDTDKLTQVFDAAEQPPNSGEGE